MPTYSYRCRECSDEFDVRRPMSEASDPAVCPDGHRDTVKLLSTVALTGSGGPSSSSAAFAGAPAGGGCCGGACGCGR